MRWLLTAILCFMLTWMVYIVAFTDHLAELQAAASEMSTGEFLGVFLTSMVTYGGLGGVIFLLAVIGLHHLYRTRIK